MTAPDSLTLDQTAALVNLSPSRFRKVWTTMVHTRSFPAPFRRPPSANYAWDRDAVLAWKAARARCGLVDEPPANDGARDVHPLDRLAPANGLGPHGAQAAHHNDNPRLARERAELRRMMQGGR